jgi:hypothetical protein
MVRIPMFGITLVVVRDEEFNIKAIRAQIDAIQPAQKSAFQPPVNTCSVAAGIPILIRNRSKKRVASTITVITVAIAIVGGSQPGKHQAIQWHACPSSFLD